MRYSRKIFTKAACVYSILNMWVDRINQKSTKISLHSISSDLSTTRLNQTLISLFLRSMSHKHSVNYHFKSETNQVKKRVYGKILNIVELLESCLSIQSLRFESQWSVNDFLIISLDFEYFLFLLRLRRFETLRTRYLGVFVNEMRSWVEEKVKEANFLKGSY